MDFMDLMNRVLLNYLELFVIFFIDDILVYYKNEDEHKGLFRKLSQVLKEHQLFPKYSKCEFWLRLVSFLGHIFSSEGIEFDTMIMEAVNNWPRPFTPTDIQSFLGLDR